MKFSAVAKYIKCSPYKLRPLADVVRGKDVSYALNWLSVSPSKRAVPLEKAIKSACANAGNRENIGREHLEISEIRVDQGPIFRYYKPGAQGRAKVQRKRYSHVSVVLQVNNQDNRTEKEKVK